MSETKFLYGAAVQGIQGFIFQTNKLREIVGASELVEEICTEVFEKLLFNNDIHARYEKIISAAGNIKYIFEDKRDMEKIVKVFPFEVSKLAPGITVSQAVVPYDDSNFKGCIDELEKKLHIQRNKQPLNPIPQFMSLERSRRTGLPAETKVRDEYRDDATIQKSLRGEKPERIVNKSFFGRDKSGKIDYYEEFALDVEKLTKDNDWIAIIHADGNSLGQVVKIVGKDKDKFKEFSNNLDYATEKAANEAFEKVIPYSQGKVTPIRPVVLGGDDLTVIIRGDLAIDYAKVFLENFEVQTEKLLGEKGLLNGVFSDGTKYLTACAGIAFVKSSYPFYYGYNLAEELCKAAKTDARKQGGEGNSIPSCIMFHKVDDTFVESLEDMTKRQLTPEQGLSFAAGPYYLKPKDNRIGIDRIVEYADRLESDEGNALKSGLRRWMTELYKGKKKADQAMHRLESITKDEMKEVLEFAKKEIPKTDSVRAYPVFDLLALHTVKYQKTKGED